MPQARKPKKPKETKRGSLLAVLALGWGLGKAVIREQLGNGLSASMTSWLTWWLRFVVPSALSPAVQAYGEAIAVPIRLQTTGGTVGAVERLRAGRNT